MTKFISALLLSLTSLMTSVSWGGSQYIHVVKRADGFRGSHAASAATVLSYAKLFPANQPEKFLTGSLASYINHCLCERSDKPMAAWIKEGVETYTGFSGLSIKIEERVKHSINSSEQISFENYKRHIDSKRPVILSFLKGIEPADTLATARHRLQGFSAVGVGYAEEAGRKYLIALDWATQVPEEAIYPNPATRGGKITVVWGLVAQGRVRIDLYDTRWNRLKGILDSEQDAGSHSAEIFLGDDSEQELEPGLYYLVIEASNKKEISKVVILR